MEQELSSSFPAAVEEEDKITPGTDSEVSSEITDNMPAEALEQAQTIDQTNTSEVEERAPLSADGQDKPTYEEEVELEILPPIDIKQIMGIMKHLDGLAEVGNTELIPLTDRPLITVFLREPVPLIEILETLPEVGQVKEVVDGKAADSAGDTHAEGKRRKIQIALSGNSVLDDAKDRLDSEVYHTLSS